MDNYLVHNGQFVLSANPLLKAGNRGFQYGDGLFESIRVMHGKPLFLESHLNRLKEGAQALKIDLPETWDLAFVEDLFDKLIALNNVESGKARWSVCRTHGGNYMPSNKGVEFVLELYPLNENQFEIAKQGLAVDVYQKQFKQINHLANFKTLNALLYVMARVELSEKKMDDALILNDEGRIAEASSSNIFFVKDNRLFTPPLTEGCVGGVMRMQIINLAIELEIPVFETQIVNELLLQADEIFLTNAIRGIQWVVSFKEKRYYHKMADFLVEELNKKVVNLTMDLPESE